VCEETQAMGEIIDANNCSSVAFILDSGTTNHLVQEILAAYMTNIEYLEHPISFQIANGQKLLTERRRKISLRYKSWNITLTAS